MKHLAKLAIIFLLLASPVFAASRAAVVRIVGQDKNQHYNQGSGVCVDPSGIILTVYHIAVATEKNRLVFFGDRSYRVTDSWIPSGEDVAILKVNGKDLPYLTIAKKSPAVGDKVWGMGFGKGVWQSNAGKIVTKSVSFDRRGPYALWGTTVPVELGQSGGPLVDSKWSVLGILSVGLIDQLRTPRFDSVKVFSNTVKWESGYLNLVRIRVAMSQFTDADKRAFVDTKRTLYAFAPGHG